jgi:uncharacterized protein
MTTRASDRKLGDEWSDWDGQSNPGDSQAGKRLFISLSGLLLLLFGVSGLLAWYLVAPRLTEWHTSAPDVLLVSVLALTTLLLLLLVGLCAALWFRWPLPRGLAAAARRMLAGTERRVLSLGRTLSINSDRAAHSMIKIHNELTLYEGDHTAPERVLVLLPRCLTKEQLKQSRELAARLGVHVAVVAGGELARKRIVEHKPSAIIGVACERDLVSGLRDVGHKLRVLGIPNERPNGPCKDTVIDMAALQAAIEVCIGTRSAAQRSERDAAA